MWLDDGQFGFFVLFPAVCVFSSCLVERTTVATSQSESEAMRFSLCMEENPSSVLTCAQQLGLVFVKEMVLAENPYSLSC